MLDIKIKLFVWVWMLVMGFIFTGCTSMTGGTHGAIKSYEYSVPKSVLEKAVWKIIETNSNI